MKLQKGDKIIARTPRIYDQGGNMIGGHGVYNNLLTVTKVFPHGVRTKEIGYVHRNNILSKEIITNDQ